MNKLQLIAGPSCLTNANADEPVFLLRANDELAPLVVRRWAYKYLALKGGITLITSEQLGKFNDALRVADAMDAYRAGVPMLDDRRFNAPNPIELKPKRQL